MAGDWIKVEKETPNKPEIAMLARKLGLTHADAFIEWFRVYAWADGVTTDGTVPFLSLSEGDRLSRCCPGTFAALASPEISWILLEGEGIRFVNWERHNGKSAKKRSCEAEKKRRQREMSRKCPDGNGTNKGPEKRREEKNKETPIVPLDFARIAFPNGYDSAEARALLEKWYSVRQRKHGVLVDPGQSITAALQLFPTPLHFLHNLKAAIGGEWKNLACNEEPPAQPVAASKRSTF